MSIKKALALIALLIILSFAALVIINTFYPNPYTAGIYTFITVTVPAYLSDKLEWVLGSIGAIITVVGAASKKIGDARDTATQQVAVAEEQKNQAQQLASDQFGEVQNLKEENAGLKQQIADMQASRTEAEQVVSQVQTENVSLKRQNQELMDKLANTPVKIVETVK